MKKLALFAAALAVVPTLAATAPVFADSPGQLQNSENFYKVKNVTKGTDYAKSVSATCGDTVKFSTMIANGEFGLLSNVMVKTTLAGATTVSATNAAGQTTSTSGSVQVNLDKGTLAYVAGSTQNLSENGTVLETLGDTITTTGVNMGSLNGSTAEFVQFQAKVTCDTAPVVKDIKVCELGTKTIITIKENEFDATKHTKDLSKCDATPVTPQTPQTPAKPAAPATIAATGPASTFAAMLGLGAVTAAATYFVRSRRNILG